MCPHLVHTVSKLATGLVPLGLVMSAALVAGCDSTDDPNSAESKAQADAARAQILRADEAANAQIKKKAGGAKNTATLKNMKGRIGAPAPADDAKPSE